jgi:hypothetical protein
MRIFPIFILFSFSLLLNAQQSIDGELKAYMYHVVLKSPILNDNIGRYFEYSGPKITLANGEINYDSIEVLILNKPDYLFIRSSEIGKRSPGIIAELANKTAIWELNKTMLAYMSGNEVEMKKYQSHFEKFQELLVSRLPEIFIRSTNRKKTFDPKLKEVLNPSVSFNLKRDLLLDIRHVNVTLAQAVLEAINESVITWVEDRAYQIFCMLGGSTKRFKNILLAAGDGSFTSGLLNEREKDVRGRFNRGLPRAIGFFPYQTRIVTNSKGEEFLITEHYPSMELQTAGHGRITNIHPDVWGYNDKKQTTLVIEKGGRQYLLFGSKETRFLSPDSSFVAGGTFMSVINDLEFRLISDLKDKIYGKQGFDYWLKFYESEADRTRYELIKIELDLKKYRESKSRNTKSGRGKIQQLQGKFISKQNYLDKCEDNIKKMTKQKSTAQDLLHEYEAKLLKMKRLVGNNWVGWKMTDGFFVFDDGSTFDIKTQDFRFAPTAESEKFEIRLLAVPFSARSNEVDEVLVHISVSDMPRDFAKNFQLSRLDWFESNSYQLNQPIFSREDTVVIRDLLEALVSRMKIEFNAVGSGIGKIDQDRLIKNPRPIEEQAYPGSTADERLLSAQSSDYKNLRQTSLTIDIKEQITIDVNSFTDPVRTNFTPNSEQLSKWLSQGKVSHNDALSVYRTAAVLMALKKELMYFAGEYLDRENTSKVIDYLEAEFGKAKISVGNNSVKLSSLF